MIRGEALLPGAPEPPSCPPPPSPPHTQSWKALGKDWETVGQGPGSDPPVPCPELLRTGPGVYVSEKLLVTYQAGRHGCH